MMHCIYLRCGLHYHQGILNDVGLSYLLLRPGGLDAVEEWADALSLGEQQRLGELAVPFVRVLPVVG